MTAPTSVDAAVKELMTPAPSEKSEERPDASATPDAHPTDQRQEPGGDAPKPLTAFEQELVEQLEEDERQEFDAATPKEQQARLAWMKKHTRREARQQTEYGTLKKAISALREAGVSAEDLADLMKRKRGGAAPEAAKADSNGKRGFARWQEKATEPGEREQLREAEQVIREAAEDIVRELLDKEVTPLKARLQAEDQRRFTTRSQQLDQAINSLEDDYGYPSALIETHRGAMLSLGLREPDLEPEDLLVRVAGFKTVKEAMAKVSAKDTEVPAGDKPAVKPGASFGPRRVSAPVVRKPTEEEPTRNSRGQVPIREMVSRLLHPTK